jgi:uncharacterized protein (TIGR04255 family)
MALENVPNGNELPDFGQPPVVEVVLSAGFQPLPALRLVEIFKFWEERIRPELPRVEEQGRYEMPLEQLGNGIQLPSVSWQVLPAPPMPRLWFLNQEGSQLLQIQNDWVARNWRRTGPQSQYPRYPDLRVAFVRDLRMFANHVSEHGMGELRFTQCEVTYINHIPIGGQDARTLAAVLKLVDDPEESFSEEAEALRVAASYRIRQDRTTIGRLHVTADPATRVTDKQAITVLNITARGVPTGHGIEGVLGFLDVGREWALRAFVGLTRDEMHHRWQKTGG